MSHISTIEIEIRDLDTLKRACLALDLEFLQDRRQFRYYAGFASCEHAIRVPGAGYELGVVRNESGYGLLWDSWRAGGLVERLGESAGRLRQAYAVERVKTEARKRGMKIRTRKQQHSVQLVLTQ